MISYACFKLTWMVSCRLNNPAAHHVPFPEAEGLLPEAVAVEEASYHPLHEPVPHLDPLALHPEEAEGQSVLLSL